MIVLLDLVVGVTAHIYYIVRELNLKPLAVFIDSGFIPEQTIINIRKTVDVLDVDLKVIKHKYLLKSFKWHFYAWYKRPMPETLISFCVGCRLGIHKFIDVEAIKQKIPIIFSGGTPFEGEHYKSNILKRNVNNNNKIEFVFGYLKQIIINPFLILNLYCVIIQVREFLTVYYLQKRRIKRNNINRISLYHSFIRWEESKIEKTIMEELKWGKHPDLKTTYRGDCEIGIIRQYLYWKLLGYNDKDDHLSCLIRDHQITRSEALERIDEEHSTPVYLLKSICKKLKIDYLKIEHIVNKVDLQRMLDRASL